MRTRSNLQQLPNADSLLRHSDVRWGLNLVHGSVHSADLDFIESAETRRRLTDIFTGRQSASFHEGLLSAEEAQQIQVWSEERAELKQELAKVVDDLKRQEQALAAENSSHAGYREDRLLEIQKTEARRQEAKQTWEQTLRRLAELERKLELARRELNDRERRQNGTGVDDAKTRAFRNQLIRLDWRIRKWRRVQRDVNNELIRQRESLVSGAADNQSKTTIDLEHVRQSLFRLEQRAESLLDVVARHSAEYKSIAPTADLNDELDGFKDQLDTVYTGLYRAHQSAAKEVSELTRERINWNLRALRRQRRDITKCIKRLMKRRADLIHEIAPYCQNEHWLIELAQNGFVLNADDDAQIAPFYEFKRPLDPAINQLKELIAKLETEQTGLSDKRDTLRSEVSAIEQRLISLRKEAERLTHDRIPEMQEQIRIHKSEIQKLEAKIRKLDQLIGERESKSRNWIHRRLSEASVYLASLSAQAYQHFAVELGQHGRLFVKNRFSTDLELSSLPPVDRDLACLAMGIALLPDWAHSSDHVVWNHALDRLTTEQAVEVAKLISENCPERLSLLITTAHTHLADRLHARGFHVLDWEMEEVELPSVLVAEKAAAMPKLVERAIILRSNNSDSEEFPGEFRDQVVRGSGQDSVFLKQENSREAYQTTDSKPSTWESSEAELLNLETELEAIRRGEAYSDVVMNQTSSTITNVNNQKPLTDQHYSSGTKSSWVSPKSWTDNGLNEALNRELDTEAESFWKERNRHDISTANSELKKEAEPSIRAYRAAPAIPPRKVPSDRVTKDSRLRDLAVFEIEDVERLESEGIILVRDFLTRDRTSIRRALGFEDVTHSQIEGWQRQLKLMCEVRKLSAFDARVLVACDIQDANSLRRLEGYELAERIEALRQRKDGQQLLRSGSDEELTKLNAWVLNMKEAKALREFGYHDSRDSDDRATPAGSNRSSRLHSNSNGSRRSERKSIRSKQNRFDRASTERHSRTSTSETLKFYLNLDDQVEAAPSIGPKMAEHLEVIGIKSVRDLLTGDAAEIANDLDQRRVKTDTVEAWQRQATLVCRVPNLRGHDSQLLVGCNINSPEELAAQNAEELFEIVQPFAQSREGAKIIRSGKQPDLEEMQDWIRWAQSQRALELVS